MKIICTVVLALIAGILSFSDALDTNYKQLCLKNGGPKAYADLESNGNRMVSCLGSLYAEVTAKLPRSERPSDEAIAVMCEKVEDDSIKNCIQSTVDSAKICQDKDGQHILDVIFKIALSLLRFGCENTELLKKALTSSDLQCVLLKRISYQRCFDGLVTQGPNSASPNPMQSLTNIPNVLSSVKLSFSSEECNEILTAEQCLVNLLGECEDKVFSEIADKLWKYVNNDIPKCKDLPRSPRSSDASPTSVINVMMLIISAITMFL